ncbi:MAG: hypothetical protein ACLS69_00775 [Butyricicoccus sp.]
MIELDRSEAIRYMGYHGTQPDEAVQASLTRCGEALQQAAEPKSIYRVFPLQHIDAQTLEIADVQIHSKNLASAGLRESAMAATLGIGPDRLIARALQSSDERRGDLSGGGSVWSRPIATRSTTHPAGRSATRGRVLSAAVQSRVAAISDRTPAGFQPPAGYAAQDGLTVTESCLLAPIKSVTAVIGLSETPQPCHHKGCEECGKTDCAYRR